MKNFIQYCLVAILMLQLTACVDQEFDVPPGRVVETNDISTTTIAALKATHQIGANASAIAAGTIIKGTVISDDSEGSFYKEMIIQDETAGILIRINRGDLSVIYGAGRQVFIKCDGLYIGDYNGLTQLGYPGEEATDIDRIPDVFVEQHVVLGADVGKVTPRVVNKIAELDDDMISTLITLSEVEFATPFIGQQLASQDGFNTQNKDVLDCDEEKVVFRASKFADYASAIVPAENGSITAVLSKYQETYQISIATLADLKLTNPRCDGTTGGGGVSGDKIKISDLQTLFAGGTDVAPNGYIEGVVISDYAQGNINNRNLVVQGESAGIIVRLGAQHSIPLGEAVQVSTNGASLSEFNGGLQINVDNFAVVKNGAGTLPEPRVTTIAELLNNFQAWESTLVKVVGAQLSGGSTFGSVNKITDSSGSIETFTFNTAAFADDPAPTGSVEVTGIVSEYNDMQITFRSKDDVVGGSTGGGGGVDGDKIAISDLQMLFNNGTTTAPNGYIEGVVISDFAQGNINNRNLVLQDDNAGIIVRFASPHSIPLGQSLKVSTNNVEISEFNGGLQINVADNAYEDNGAGTLPAPRVATIAELLANFQAWESTLVKIVGAELSGGSTISAINTITDATGSISTFTFNSAAFADEAAPTGMVDVTGIVSEYNDMQLTFRSRADIEGGSTGGGGGTGDLISLEALRTAFESGTTSAPNGYIEGVVISDYTTGSVTAKNLHIQDATGGIVLRFGAAHEYALGAKLKVNVGGTQLSEFRGLLQLNNVDASQVESVSTGTLPTPRAATLAEVASNLENWESTLVVIENVTFSGSDTFEGALTADDGTASLTMFTRGAATFAGSSVPSGPVTVTAIVSQYDDAQILIRSLDDIN